LRTDSVDSSYRRACLARLLTYALHTLTTLTLLAGWVGGWVGGVGGGGGSTQTIKKTSAVTQSVANTAKRVIVIVGVAIVLKVLRSRLFIAINDNCMGI
jgi:hypothetical protein